jgi:Glycosyl transferase family 2
MPVFDGAAFLRPALESILTQTGVDLELVVIDDGSTDDTPGILAAIDDPRLLVVRQPHAGLVAALNRGLELARGTYVARMDADDLSLPGRLEAQARFLDRHPQTALVGSRFAHVDEEGHCLNDGVWLPRLHESIWVEMLRGRLGVLHATAMVRRPVLQELGGYDPDFSSSEDVELFARLLHRYRAANLPHVLYLWRIRRASICSARVARQRASEAQVQWMMWRSLWTGHCEPTGGERRAARARNHGAERAVPRRAAHSAYHKRVGHALLAGHRWREARHHLGRSLHLDPRQRSAWFGWLRAALRTPAATAARSRTGVA